MTEEARATHRLRAVGACLDGTLAFAEQRLRQSLAPPPRVLNDHRLFEAMIHPARIRMEAWYNSLQRHRGHPTFHAQTWAYTLEYGFTCACSGTEQEWRIRVSDLHGQIPEARDVFRRLLERQGFGASTRKARIALHRAEMKARALLHRYLTKAQRWDLRASGAFKVTGQDGRTYRIGRGSAHNIELWEGGKITYTLCAVIEYRFRVPIYDLLLAQKTMLEGAIEPFLRMANVFDPVKKRCIGKGEFLLNGQAPPEPPHLPIVAEVQRVVAEPQVPEITRHDIEHPEVWVRTQLRMTEGEPDDFTDRTVPEAAQ